MSAWTVCFIALLFPATFEHEKYPPMVTAPAVFFLSDSFQMVWVDTASVTTSCPTCAVLGLVTGMVEL